jgi:uncharacterized alkaline shock family protein YloU
VGLDRPGIRLTTEGGLRLDLFINVAHGVPVAEVARQVDSAVRYSLRHYVGTEVAALTIHVDGLRYEPNALERAEAIERSDAAGKPGPAPEGPGNQTAAAGAPVSRKRKPR